MKNGSYLKNFASVKKRMYITSVVFAIIGVLGEMIPYFAISQIIVLLINKNYNNINDFFNWFLLIIAGILIKVIFHNISTSISHKATFSVISNIRKAIADKVVLVPMGFVLDIPTGEMKSTMVEKVDSTEPILAHAVPEMTSNLLVPLIILVYIFILNWKMGIATILTVPIGFICLMGMMKDYEVKFKEMTDVQKNMNSTAIEYINGIEVIKAFSQSASSYAKYQDSVKQNCAYGLNWMKSVQKYFAAGLGIGPAGLVTVLPIGCLLIMNNDLKISSFITIILLTLGIFGPILKAMNFVDDLAKVNTIMDDIGNIISEKNLDRPTKDVIIPNSNIELKNVSFSYKDDKVLKNVNLYFKQGQVNALVGPSGGGKSTIAKLVASFWEPNNGDILIGGINTKNIPLSQLNSKIAYVAQDNFLFNETILENIRKGNVSATDEEVIEASKKTGCHEFITNLENGYNTLVGGSGGHLSGGERQRITIARAMLKNADIIILDEATAYTDPENEAIIQESVSKLAKGKTLIVIAHRLSTIIDSDKIYVINNGTIDNSGKFNDLLEKSPLFKQMWKAHESSKDIKIKEESYA